MSCREEIEMASSQNLGWQELLEGFPWFRAEGQYPLLAYSELTPPPRFGRSPYGGFLPEGSPDSDPFGWNVNEAEQELEIRPDLNHLAERLLEVFLR